MNDKLNWFHCLITADYTSNLLVALNVADHLRSVKSVYVKSKPRKNNLLASVSEWRTAAATAGCCMIRPLGGMIVCNWNWSMVKSSRWDQAAGRTDRWTRNYGVYVAPHCGRLLDRSNAALSWTRTTVDRAMLLHSTYSYNSWRVVECTVEECLQKQLIQTSLLTFCHGHWILVASKKEVRV